MEKRKNPVIEIIEAIETDTTKQDAKYAEFNRVAINAGPSVAARHFIPSLDINDEEKKEAITYCEKKFIEAGKLCEDLKKKSPLGSFEEIYLAQMRAVYDDVLQLLDREYILKRAKHLIPGVISRYDIADAVEFGTDVNAKDKDGNTALDLFMADAHQGKVKFEVPLCLVKYGAEVKDDYAFDLIYNAVMYHDTEALSKMKDKINIPNEDGETNLHLHIDSYIGTLSLLENGANPYAKNKDGKTAIDLLRKKARFRGITREEEEIMSILIKAQNRTLLRKVAKNRFDEEEKLNKGRKEGEKRIILPKMSILEKIEAKIRAKGQLGA